MTNEAFPLLVAYEFLYVEAGRYYSLLGARKRIELSENQYSQKIDELRKTNTQYILLYDYMFTLKMDKWEAEPTGIDINEVEFYYQLSVLDEEIYMYLKYLHSIYSSSQE